MTQPSRIVKIDVSGGAGLGFRLMKRKGAKGFAIKAVDADGLAKKAGGVAKGDCEYLANNYYVARSD